MAKNVKFVNMGAIIKRKDGGLCIKLNTGEGSPLKSLNINGKLFKGEYLNLDKPQVKYERMLEKGMIDEDEFEEKLENIPDFVKYEITAVLE
tara:strand:+ start:857 stop:1132 length:276 start_codon:yes stop_codon:yes gene_type:complete